MMVGERSRDGVGIFELRQELDEGRRLAGFARWALLEEFSAYCSGSSRSRGWVYAGDWHFFPLRKMWRHSMYMLALRGAAPGGVLGKFFFLQAVTGIGVSHSFAINVKGWAISRTVRGCAGKRKFKPAMPGGLVFSLFI